MSLQGHTVSKLSIWDYYLKNCVASQLEETSPTRSGIRSDTVANQREKLLMLINRVVKKEEHAQIDENNKF